MPRRVRPNSLTTDQATEAHLEAINVDENGRFQDEPAEREGRGAKKARAEQLERLGEALVALKPGQLARVAMPNDLLVAVKEAQRIRDKKALGGHRRQIQLVGKIMRTLDAEPIAKALEALAVIYACLESATVGQPVSVADVLSGAAHAYEDTIEAARPALTEVGAERVS